MKCEWTNQQQRASAERRLVTVAEAAEALALDRLTVSVAIARKKLRVVYLGTSIRVPVDALDEYVAALPNEPARRALRVVIDPEDRTKP